MLEVLFGSKSAERVLLYLANYSWGYGAGIRRTFKTPLSMVQKQLRKLELGGVLISYSVGRTRVYEFSPRWHFRAELLDLLQKALAALPESELKAYYRERRRPRIAGKPITLAELDEFERGGWR